MSNANKLQILALTVLAACNQTAQTKHLVTTRFIQPEFVELVTEFEAEYNVTINFPVTYAKLNPTNSPTVNLGACHHVKGTDQPISVEIDTMIQSDEALFLVLRHELAHCILNQPHFDGELDLMNTNGQDIIAKLKAHKITKTQIIDTFNERTGLGN